ncbi:hypothetical protein IVA80_04915, partial [Bradyrhizobium sp. 139]|uniref:hypothetical protein n=1 Tax=Bradyrhizobium sp. 139 TaxID=2782616 RepID=UPI001FFA1E37
MLTININWEYFLATVGTLIVLAYYANGRFTKLEKNVEWLKAIEALTQSGQAARKLDDRFQEICVGTDWVLADSSFAIGAMRSDIMAG